MRIAKNRDEFDTVLKYFDGFANQKAEVWICPTDSRPITAEDCLENYLDALDEIDNCPDHECFDCESEDRKKSWVRERERMLKEKSREKVSPQISDPVSHPSHYTVHKSGVECIQITEHMGFLTGNAMKYLWRCEHKGKKIEDLKKAIWYLERAVAADMLEGEVNDSAS